jgi:hypothetical protein
MIILPTHDMAVPINGIAKLRMCLVTHAPMDPPVAVVDAIIFQPHAPARRAGGLC